MAASQGCRVGNSRSLGDGRGSQESRELQTRRAKKPRKDSDEGRGALGRKSQQSWQSRGLGWGPRGLHPNHLDVPIKVRAGPRTWGWGKGLQLGEIRDGF